jgi:hypothetical protein
MRKPDRKRSPRTRKTTTMQAKHRESQTKATTKEDGIVLILEKRAFIIMENNGQQGPRETAFCWTTDQR